jgi:Amt family ammonium transporter
MMKNLIRSASAVAFFISRPLILSADTVESNATRIDHSWILLAIALVAFMQIGFLLLECGFVRSKTTINVAQKNLTDFVVSVAGYWFIGFSLMFGVTVGGWFGASGVYMLPDRLDGSTLLFFTFQAMFCGTAATIVSGVIAERCSFWGYTLAAIFIGTLIYPVAGHWAWGSALRPENSTFLGQFGFMDFAGSTVVHGVGAWVALAAAIVIGPRLGRFGKNGEVLDISGHNPVISAAGALILLVGWLGFNGGSALALSDTVPTIIANTVFASVFGGIGGLLYSVVFDGRKLKVDRVINGLLGGLVCVTAGPDVFGIQSAALVGFIGGLAAQYFNYLLLHVWKIDDVVGAIGVHGFSGAIGTILVGVLAPSESLVAASRAAQIAVQIGGVLLVFAWAFGVSYLCLKIINNFVPLRVSEKDEFDGLNTAEHGQTLGTGHLQQMLVRMLENDARPGELIKVEQGDESGELSTLFNQLTLRMAAEDQKNQRRSQREMANLEERKRIDELLVEQISTMIENAAKGVFHDRINAPKGASRLLSTACEGVNQLFDVVDSVTDEMEIALKRLASGDLQYRMETSNLGKFAGMSHDFNRSVDNFSEAQARSTLSMKRMTKESRVTADDADDALRDIQYASNEALKIVEIIEDIAAKTNLLALNASIEAARAGQHGRAFGVVADQVQALSARVGKSSTDISEIISKNSTTVGSGMDAIQKVRHTLLKIDNEISQLSDHVECLDVVAA